MDRYLREFIAPSFAGRTEQEHAAQHFLASSIPSTAPLPGTRNISQRPVSGPLPMSSPDICPVRAVANRSIQASPGAPFARTRPDAVEIGHLSAPSCDSDHRPIRAFPLLNIEKAFYMPFVHPPPASLDSFCLLLND